MIDIDSLRSQRIDLTQQINDIEAAERDATNAALVGKCFVFRNCHSCPQSPADYWNLFLKVLGASDGNLTCLTFETDKNGQVTVRPLDQKWSLSGGYTEISELRFVTELEALVKRLDSLI